MTYGQQCTVCILPPTGGPGLVLHYCFESKGSIKPSYKVTAHKNNAILPKQVAKS